MIILWKSHMLFSSGLTVHHIAIITGGIGSHSDLPQFILANAN
jgi:hypothetical protein